MNCLGNLVRKSVNRGNMLGTKRQYTKKVIPRLLKRKEFLIRHLQREWEEAERSTRREDMVRAVKSGGIALGKGLLVLLLIAGVLTVAAMAPNVFSAFGRMRGRGKYRTYIPRDHFRQEAGILRKQDFISLSKEGQDEYKLCLTKSGERRAIQRAFNTFKIPIVDRWDGIWRMVIFDIPNKRKPAREGFRRKLKTSGFYPLQKSVFVFPYPCEEELKFLAYLYDVGDYVRLVETSKILHDDDLRSYFSFT